MTITEGVDFREHIQEPRALISTADGRRCSREQVTDPLEIGVLSVHDRFPVTARGGVLGHPFSSRANEPIPTSLYTRVRTRAESVRTDPPRAPKGTLYTIKRKGGKNSAISGRMRQGQDSGRSGRIASIRCNAIFKP
jgi:hypothetical protein